jgi:pimeloyl-ACP methyl ester carboxylesterase
MPVTTINGIKLFWELSGGTGDPIVLVHGSWIDHHNWDAVVPLLARSFRVLTYDRRGHSQSERPASPYSIRADVADLAALIEVLRLGPAHIVGNSSGGSVVLRLAGERPDLFRSLIVNEPALLDLLADAPGGGESLSCIRLRMKAVMDLIAAGEHEGAAQQFVETIEPGGWAEVPPEVKEAVIFNAPMFLEQMRDLDFLSMNLARLRGFGQPALLTLGEHGPPFFPPIVDKVATALPQAERHVFTGAGHEPEQTHPDDFVAAVVDFIARQATTRRRASG